jgi:hypothetical protein
MWVLIVFYFSGGSPAVAMHDFSNKTVCEQAAVAASAVQKELKGIPQVRGLCVPKG